MTERIREILGSYRSETARAHQSGAAAQSRATDGTGRRIILGMDRARARSGGGVLRRIPDDPAQPPTYDDWFFARTQAALLLGPDSMGAAKATQQRGGSVGWSNVSPRVDAEWQTLRDSSDTNCSQIRHACVSSSPGASHPIVNRDDVFPGTTAAIGSTRRRLIDSPHVDANLDLLSLRFRRLKPPRFPTLFEALANGIACQHMKLTLGILPQSTRGTIGRRRAVDIRKRSCVPAPRRVGEHGAIRISQAGVQPVKRTLPDRAIAHFFQYMGNSTRKRSRILATKRR